MSCATGGIKAIPTGRDGTPFSTAAYAIPPEMVRQIMKAGGMLKVTLSPKQASPDRFESLRQTVQQRGVQANTARFETAWVEVWEKKP